MKKKTKTITVGFQSFKIIKELENTIIVSKGGKRYVYHKKKKIIVTPNYDAKPIVKVAEIKARTGRANNDSYSLIRHQNLSDRVQKIMDKRKCYRFEIAGEIGFSTATLATFLKNKKVNGSSLDVVESWLEKNE